MQSFSRPPENFPLQGGGTVVVSMPEHPKDYIVWSLASLFYGNPFCLGLSAVHYSVKSRDRKMMGDMEGARTYGSKACRYNTTAIALVVISFIIFIYFFAVEISEAVKHIQSETRYP